MRSGLLGLAISLAGVLLGGCIVDVDPPPEQALPRRLDPAYPVTPDTRQLHFLVMVYGPCPPPAGRITTAVDYRQGEIAVSIVSPGHGSCLTSDDFIELAVDLAEPLGDRRIVSLDQPEPMFGLLGATFLRDHGASRPTPSDPGYVSQEQLGAAWPFTVPYGALLCEVWGPQQEVAPVVLFAAPDGTLYAIKRHGEFFLELPPVEDIWLPELDGHRVSIEPITDRGLELCA